MTVTADWSVLEIPEIDAVLDGAARRVASQYTSLEFDDLRQEGVLALVTRAPEFWDSYEKGGLGYVANKLWQDITNEAAKMTRRTRLDDSLDRMLERGRES